MLKIALDAPQQFISFDTESRNITSQNWKEADISSSVFLHARFWLFNWRRCRGVLLSIRWKFWSYATNFGTIFRLDPQGWLYTI